MASNFQLLNFLKHTIIHGINVQVLTAVASAQFKGKQKKFNIQGYLRSALVHDVNKFISSDSSKSQCIGRTKVWDAVIWLLCQNSNKN